MITFSPKHNLNSNPNHNPIHNPEPITNSVGVDDNVWILSDHAEEGVDIQQGVQFGATICNWSVERLFACPSYATFAFFCL